MYDNFPIVALAFAGLQALYGRAADALEMPTNDPARTSAAIDSAEILLDTLSSTKTFNRPQFHGARIGVILSSLAPITGVKSEALR